ncbi:MAG: DNA alkylation repair protein [Dehalococcoidia bacterium]|nr:MAG: DNA alkylation repair protein [Dehalococcoidia bacterium]
MATAEAIIAELKSKAKSDQLAGMARYGMAIEQRLGASVPEMRQMAKAVGKDHQLALELWETGIAEARIIAAMIDEPDKLTEAQMEDWVKGINSWDICDQVCMNLFEKSPLAWQKITDWSAREEEFVKRTAYSLLACLAWHDKETKDEKFMALFPVLIRGATDERNFVKKAVNWALRNIGKRNLNLNQAALNTAKEIQKIDARAARWIASDAIRELESEPIQAKLKGKATKDE